MPFPTRYSEITTPGPGGSPFKIGEYYNRSMKDGHTFNRSDVNAQLSVEWNRVVEWKRRWDENHGGPPYRRGGSFFLTHRVVPCSVQGSGDYLMWYEGAGSTLSQRRYVGGFTDPSPTVGVPSVVPVSGIYTDFTNTTPTQTTANRFNPCDVEQLGDEAYSVLRPKVEVSNLAQAVYELREAPEMYKQSARGFVELYRSLGGSPSGAVMRFVGSEVKAADGSVLSNLSKAPSLKDPIRALANAKPADHFLNHVFGWAPFVKDVVGLCDTTINYDNYCARAKYRNDKWRRRYFAKPVEVTDEVLYDGSQEWKVDPSPFLLTVPGFKCRFRVLRRRVKRVWYVGSFKTYNPEFDNDVPMHPAVRQMRQMMTLYGANINPTVVWKVTPWTWMVDWFSNVGRLVQRGQDALSESNVCKYVYVMQNVKDEYVFQQTFNNIDGVTQSMEWSFSGEMKSRSKTTNPFAFQLGGSSLSGTQTAILVALGLSRLQP